MASVFLSYDRDDADRARVLAQALERAGHSVWWDFHLKGGAEYGKEIEQALAGADAVVVLWSLKSVESAWVRDEAAAGRDSGRLVPVRIDSAEPPLGFRQYQTIDLGNWKGRGKPHRLREILASIEGLTGSLAERAVATAKISAVPKIPRMFRFTLITAVVLVAIAAAYFLIQRGDKHYLHTVAVTAADPSARPLARDLLANLGDLLAGRTRSLRLISQNEEAEATPDLILEATSGAVPGQVGAGLVLKSGRGRGILWSRDFAQASRNLTDLKQQMSLTAGRVVGCAIEGLGADGRPLDEQSLKLYVNGCAQFAEVGGGDIRSPIAVFRQVLRQAPRFRAAWAKLLIAESAATLAERDAPLPTREAARAAGNANRSRNSLRQDIVTARELQPDMAELVLAEAAMLPGNAYGETLRLLDRAKQSSPENASVLGFRAAALMKVGRLKAAIEDSRQAAELAPLSPSALTSYVLTLAYAGRIDTARVELQRAERLWPETPALRVAQYEFHWHFGDPLIALKLTPPGLPPGREMFLRARAEPTQANVNQFLTFIRAMYRRQERTDVGPAIVQQFAAFHQEDELYTRILDPRNTDITGLSEILFQPPLKTFRRDRRFMLVAKKAGLVDYWQKSGMWPDFCFEEELPYDCKAEAAKVATR